MIREIDSSELEAMRGVGMARALDGQRGLLIRDHWTAAECQRMRQVFEQAGSRRRRYQPYDYELLGAAYSLYRASNIHARYLEDSAAANRFLDEVLPGAGAAVTSPIAHVEGEPVIERREPYGGPTFVLIDEAGKHEPHFDLNPSLVDAHELARPDVGMQAVLRLAALHAKHAERGFLWTCVGMVSLPQSGGELRVWDWSFRLDGSDYDDQIRLAREQRDYVDVRYREGSLLIIDSLSMHQVRPCTGARLTLNAHVLRAVDGRLRYWY